MPPRPSPSNQNRQNIPSFKYSRIPSRASLALQRYEARWVSPLSTGTIVGVLLFGIFVGSAIQASIGSLLQPNIVWSTQRRSSSSSDIDAASAAKEATLCRSSAAMAKPVLCSATADRVLFVQPYGGLGSRLRAVASALTLGVETGAEVVIVWESHEYGFHGEWNDFFSTPKLNIGCFPGRVLRPSRAACSVHRVYRREEWLALQNKWETIKVDGKRRQVLCISSTVSLSPLQRTLRPFFGSLTPSPAVRYRIDAFKDAVGWDNANTSWVGVHVRRQDLKLQCNSVKCTEGVPVEEMLPLRSFISLMEEIRRLGQTEGINIRFFVSSDDEKSEEAIKAAIMGSSTSDAVVSLSDSTAETISRSTVQGIQEASASMFLLGMSRVLVATVGSTFSQAAAHLVGARGGLALTVGAELEEKTALM